MTEHSVRIETEIKKWGNSMALRVTGTMAALPQFKPGTPVVVDVDRDGFVVKRADERPMTFRFPHTEAALLAAMTPENAHAELLANPRDTEVGL